MCQNIRQRRLTSPFPRLIDPVGDKGARFLRHLPLIEEGRLFLPSESGWLAAYLDELLSFPRSRHDDQIDSTSQALDYLVADAARSTPPLRRDPERRP